MKLFTKIIFISFTLTLIISAKNKDIPEWFSSIPKETGFIITAAKGKTIDEARTAAYRMISEQISVSISSILTKNKEITANLEKASFKLDRVNKSIKESFDESIETSSDQQLYGVTIEKQHERWINNKDREYYVLARMNEENIIKIIKRYTIFPDTVTDKLKEIHSSSADKIKTISIGNFNLKNNNISSEFSAFLGKMVKSIIIDNRLFNVMDQSNISRISSENNLNPTVFTGSRGIEIKGKNIKSLEKSQFGILYGEYWLTETDATFFINLIDVGTGYTLESKSFTLPKKSLPDIEMLPDNYNEASDTLSKIDSLNYDKALNIEIWTDRGDGATYVEGDKILINIQSDSDCYIKIFYVNAGGNLIKLLPNNFTRSNFINAGRTYSFGNGDDFDFVIAPPFGTEIIYVVASKNQFSDVNSPSFYDIEVLGFFKNNDIFKQLKSTISSKVFAVKTSSYTVIKRSGK